MAEHCSFDGPADGESVFKECKNIVVKDCFFNLRYPFWHNYGLEIYSSEMTKMCRAVLWYSDNITIVDTKLYGIKALQECKSISIKNSDIISPEFVWSVKEIQVSDSIVSSEYFLM